MEIGFINIETNFNLICKIFVRNNQKIERKKNLTHFVTSSSATLTNGRNSGIAFKISAVTEKNENKNVILYSKMVDNYYS